MTRLNWTREQSILALFLYCQIPFGQITPVHRQIAETAQLIGRSPNSLKMKMFNFARFDPERQRRGICGLSNGSRLDEEIWTEFSSDFGLLSYEATVISASLKKQMVDSFVDLADFPDIPLGNTRTQIVKARIQQNFSKSSAIFIQ